MPERHLRLLAFDFGLKKIGVATGQTLTGTANELTILPAKQGQPDWHDIEKLFEDWKPDKLIVGLPLNMDGSESEIGQLARKFANRLHGRFGLGVEMMDERLTSREAREFGTDGPMDHISARLILESWMRNRAEA